MDATAIVRFGRVARALIAVFIPFTLQSPPMARAADAPSLTEVNDAIGRAETRVGRMTDDSFDLDSAHEAIAKAHDARERGDLEGAFEQAEKINLELDKVLDEQSGDN